MESIARPLWGSNVVSLHTTANGREHGVYGVVIWIHVVIRREKSTRDFHNTILTMNCMLACYAMMFGSHVLWASTTNRQDFLTMLKNCWRAPLTSWTWLTSGHLLAVLLKLQNRNAFLLARREMVSFSFALLEWITFYWLHTKTVKGSKGKYQIVVYDSFFLFIH